MTENFCVHFGCHSISCNVVAVDLMTFVIAGNLFDDKAAVHFAEAIMVCKLFVDFL